MTKLTFQATFSLDGRYVYAINDQQEVCKIDFQGFQVVGKSRIEVLGNPEVVISAHIKQVAPYIFAIGSTFKTQATKDSEFEASFKPYLHLVSGDLFDSQEEGELKIKAIEIPSLASDPNRAIVFRSLYVKER